MRSIAVFLSVFATLPVALAFPFAGVLLWAWIAFMNPHREAFGLAYNFPFNFYVAAVTLAAWVMSQETKRLPAQTLPALFIAFAVLFSISTYFALDHDYSFDRWEKHIRTVVLIVLVMILANSRLRIQAFLWIVAISIGYYAAKGGGGVLATGGVGGRIYGPDGSMISDNNDLALAIVMTIPVFNHLRVTSSNAMVKLACMVVTILSVLAVVGTYSRTGFIGLVAVGVGFIVFSKPKLGALLIPVALALGVWSYAPKAWFDRIGTIETYESDSSANQRFAAWGTSWNLAVDRPLLGGGFAAIETERVDRRYNKLDWRAEKETQEKSRTRAAHSLYFQVLGDHGFVGLGIWLAIVGFGMLNLFRVLALARGRDDLTWASGLARALIVSFIAYLTAGAFLSMAYYDAFLCLVALTAPLRELVARAVKSEHVVTEPAPGDDALVPGWRTARASSD